MDLDFTAILFLFLRQLWASYQNLPHARKCVRLENACPKSWGPKTTFFTTSQLDGNFNGLYIQNNDIHNRASAL